ncbi:MAG TPA: glycoside hydrolase family 38 C-terminal domain-containing protein [Lacunisphaera sp.]|nr:glycoside hydrolase family 38 C-terminal domain-containing protein [Lacunisphaera sp.]
MLPRSYLAQLTPPRIAEAVRRIEALVWQPLPGRCTVTQTESTAAHRTFAEIRDAQFTPVPGERFFWGPKYAQRWFHVTLPPAEDSETRYLVWEDQGEATAYLEGVPYYGLDIAHRHCPLPASVKELHIEAVCIRTGVWLDGTAPVLHDAGSDYQAPRLVRRHDLAWSVFHDLRVLLDVIICDLHDTQPQAKAVTDPVRYSPVVLRASPFVRRWFDRLERALDVLDREGLPAFAAALKTIYAAFPAERDAVRAVLTGHAHIDLVWLWPERVGEFKTIHTWATATRMLEMYPEMRFGFSQSMAYRAVKRRAPALYQRVQGLIARGSWEAVGASYVESDTHLPCGEALLRSLQLGQEDFRALRGTISRVFWLPDVFGYNACLPQLLRGVGVTGFFTTKLSWSSITRFPHTSFRWRGLDGSEVAAHVSLLHDYNEAVGIRNLREDVMGHQQAAVHPEVLVPTGYGDGGGGPTEAMCERARRVADLAGVPPTAWGGIEQFFDRLTAVEADLPVMAGELAVEIHRGVFTTHGRLKAAFRGLERALQVREAAHVALGLGPIPAETWRRLVFAQFHDYIPGSSIWEVYAEAIPELEALGREALAASRTALNGSQAPAPAGWFNPLPVPRRWLCDGQLLELGPLQSAAIATARPAPAVVAEGLVLRSNRVEAECFPDGGLKRLVVDGHEVRLRDAGHALWSYPDQPAISPAWDVDRGTLANGEVAICTGTPARESAAGSAALVFSFAIPSGNAGRVRYELRAGEPVLRVRYSLDWRDPATLLKAVITTGYTGSQARFGCPFGSVLRAQWPGYPREEAQWEVPASRWMILGDDAQSEGLSVITEAKYGFTVRDGAVGISLVRSALITEAGLHPGIRDLPDRPQHSDLGAHEIDLALGRFSAAGPAAEHPATLADTLFTPCLPCETPGLAAGLGSLDCSPSVTGAWAKPLAPNTWVLRLQETDGRHGSATLTLAAGWSAGTTTLQETEPTQWTQGSVRLSLSPYAVVSVMLKK